MAKQAEDIAIRILRDIQATLADHGKRFDGLDLRLDEVPEGMLTAPGLAGHAHVRPDGIKKDIDELKRRVKRLEAKV